MASVAKANETLNQFQLVSLAEDFTPAPNCILNVFPNYRKMLYGKHVKTTVSILDTDTG